MRSKGQEISESHDCLRPGEQQKEVLTLQKKKTSSPKLDEFPNHLKFSGSVC